MLKLYYTLGSPPSRAVLQTIRVLGLEVEVKKLDLMKGENLTSEFLGINPLHQVPVLIDGKFVVAESRAIMTYLINSRRPDCDWYPMDPKVRARIDQLLYFEAINFFELVVSILRPMILFEVVEIPEEKITKLQETLNIMDSFLEDNLYFAGNHPTIVDISILSTFILFKASFTNYGDLPNILSWYQRCQSLPGFEENLSGSKHIKDLMASKGIPRISIN